MNIALIAFIPLVPVGPVLPGKGSRIDETAGLRRYLG
jgi:hypothetical protein